MHFLLILLVALPHATTFLFGGGCCGAPVVQSPCCGGATSWAYAPPQVIGYERIPLYAKVPMPAPPSYAVRPVPRVQPPPPAYPPPYYPSSPPMDNFASGPSSGYGPSISSVPEYRPSGSSISSVSGPLSSAIPPPQDKYNDGDVIEIETDDSRRRRLVQPPPSGYVSQPVAPQGYQQQPQQQFPGQIEQGIEVTPEQISSGYQPQQQFGGDSSNYGPQSGSQFGQQSGNQFGSQGSQFGSQSGSQSTGLVDSVASSAAYEATGIAPNARRLRKFKN